MVVRRFAIFLLAILIPPWSTALATSYEDFQIGKLQGKLIVQWWAPDQFIFLPDREAPLRFSRANGETIVPGKMFTDGGSIPRPLWIFRNYSPWGYAPAFIVHDWLFFMKHCSMPGSEKYDHHSAATILAEVVKTMMETKKVDVAKLTLLSMYEAVDSSVAGKYWESGKCTPPPAGMSGKKPIAEFEIIFD